MVQQQTVHYSQEVMRKIVLSMDGKSDLRRAEKGCVKAPSTPEISKIRPQGDKIFS